MKKMIGIMPLYDDEKESYWMLPGYMKMLEAENAVPLMLPLTDKAEELDYFLDICGGFLLTGGHDVSPSVYHSEKKPWCGECCVLRDTMDAYIFRNAVRMDKPVLGICRGIQLMNACSGGDLYQDLDTEYKSGINHHMTPPYDRPAHQVKIVKGSLLSGLIGAESFGVNSYHHQAVKQVSAVFETAAVSEDGLTEAIYMPDKRFVLGVQWHPEFSWQTDENSKKIVKAFVDSVIS